MGAVAAMKKLIWAAYTWPTLDSVLLVINEEPIVSRLLDELAVLDASSQQGF